MCCQEKDEQRAQYTRTIFDAIPVPALVVDEDVVIHDLNAAAEEFLGPEAPAALYRRGGEAMHCLRAEPGGCGRAAACADCLIRQSVAQALAGRDTTRQGHRITVRREGESLPVNLLVTASLLPYTEPPRVLVILEPSLAMVPVARRAARRAAA